LLRLDIVVVAVGDHNPGGPFVQLTLVSSSWAGPSLHRP
jgi:hypothetical protein